MMERINERPSYIYLAVCQQYFKIGRANDPQQRVRELQVGNPCKVELVFAWSCDSRVSAVFESALHKKFAHRLVQGEWFALSRPEYMWFLQDPLPLVVTLDLALEVSARSEDDDIGIVVPVEEIRPCRANGPIPVVSAGEDYHWPN